MNDYLSVLAAPQFSTVSEIFMFDIVVHCNVQNCSKYSVRAMNI